MIKSEHLQHPKLEAVILILKLHLHKISNFKKQKALLKAQELKRLMPGKINQYNRRTNQTRRTISKRITVQLILTMLKQSTQS